ncbi:ABC transporter ATP-binding protein [Hippea maritima]|uniref:ABC transporter related protein n=1 Tax=Hippea maritima (strain ATCC 700847 / DSM 10411 / MH2) TaxID=760142 RepID=F2LWU9_HIPMA|nr:ATP-binding cassette domain-containing protein [Hippea maritima]AEA33077.1 ABC transporter related protein [Hippea maritima DSM 10411]
MILKLEHLVIGFNQKVLLNKIDATFNVGFNLIVGESGSGKTTLLRTINLLIKPLGGRMFFEDLDILSMNEVAWRSRCIMLPQGNYFFSQTPMESIEMVFSFKAHKNKKIDKEKLLCIAKKFNLKERVLQESSANLSGGERQRIALIRNILLDPEVALFDEPTSALDINTAETVFSYLKGFCKSKVCLIVSHETIAEKFADKIFTIKDKALWLNR